ASDATTLTPDGPLAGSTFHGAYSWAAWFYRFMVRERRLLSPEAAIHRMTGLPADILGLSDRGRIRLGASAYIAIFRPAQFGEGASVYDPNQTAIGVRYVFVNGVQTLANGGLTGERAGRVLRDVRPGRREAGGG